MNLFKIFYLIIYIYPFQVSHVIASELLNGQNLCSWEPLRFFNLSPTHTDSLGDVLSSGHLLLVACRMCIDACDLRSLKGTRYIWAVLKKKVYHESSLENFSRAKIQLKM